MDNKEILFKLGYKIKFERNKMHLSQEGLADLAGLSPRTISMLESGKNNITFTNLYKIAKALNLEIKDLVDYTL